MHLLLQLYDCKIIYCTVFVDCEYACSFLKVNLTYTYMYLFCLCSTPCFNINSLIIIRDASQTFVGYDYDENNQFLASVIVGFQKKNSSFRVNFIWIYVIYVFIRLVVTPSSFMSNWQMWLKRSKRRICLRRYFSHTWNQKVTLSYFALIVVPCSRGIKCDKFL